MRLTILLLAALSLAIAACSSGNDTTPTPAPTATAAPTSAAASRTPPPVQTEEPTPTATSAGSGDCLPSDLAGAQVLVDAAAGTQYFQFGLTNISDHACTLEGAPDISFADSNGDSGGVVVDYNTADCGQGNPTVCIADSPVDLPSGAATPAAGVAPGQVTITVAIANAGNFPGTPTATAHFLVLDFPGLGFDIRIPFDQDVPLVPEGQASLHGYGLSQTP
ncbi:MAG: DUF4232 domain-containing protein [Chloroflexota bacterium]